jgi:hypothetical protein
MKTGRLEAFSRRRDRDHHHDHGTRNESASRRQPKRLVVRTAGFLTYVLSFVCVGIYWNNHHHLDPGGLMRVGSTLCSADYPTTLQASARRR